MKIEFEKYQKPLADYLVFIGVLTPEKAELVFAEIRDYINSHLRCRHCGKFFEDDSFYKSGSQSSRRGRYIVCKVCYQDYIKGKAYEGS